MDFIWGLADLGGVLDASLGEFRYGISIGKRLDGRIVDGLLDGPTREYFEHYRAVNDQLAAIAGGIVEDLRGHGIEAMAIAPTVSGRDLDTIYAADLRTPFPHKMAATRAGLGWIGKCALFVSKRFGPRLRLVTVLTDRPVGPVGHPVTKGRCGTCRVCIDGCPAGAVSGAPWDVSVDRDALLDARKCRNQCTEFGKRYFDGDIRICGICVAVCPVGRKESQKPREAL
ncbi:MAG: epoxyqueuosine reductase [Acidobacteria bacterium]|nr:epoxyqueuosine reductase [Acidobacteriota bacterium]